MGRKYGEVDYGTVFWGEGSGFFDLIAFLLHFLAACLYLIIRMPCESRMEVNNGRKNKEDCQSIT